MTETSKSRELPSACRTHCLAAAMRDKWTRGCSLAVGRHSRPRARVLENVMV